MAKNKVAPFFPDTVYIMASNRQFQAKTPKYKNRNISETINPFKTKIEDQPETNNCTSWVVQYYPDQIQYGCRPLS